MDITTRKITRYEKHLLTDIERFSLTFGIKDLLQPIKIISRCSSHASGVVIELYARSFSLRFGM